ncbi:MAG: hypothetical protein MI861_29395, partial [Pirellulales bacterium]|nr:hypothetical protein [Pirellulales bacterium]
MDLAMDAWKTTLKLAPAQQYAQRMVDTLQGKIAEADVRLDVIETMLNQGLAQLAHTEIHALKRQPLSEAQVQRLLLQEAETLLDLDQASAALKPLGELIVRNPEQSNQPQTRLLMGRAKIGLDDSVAEGIDLLQQLTTDAADSPEGAAAELALIVFQLRQGENQLDRLSAWIDGHPRHPDRARADRAIVKSVGRFLAQAAQMPPPEGDQLSPAESRALTAAKRAFEVLQRDQPAEQLAQTIAKHVQDRLVARKAFQAANQALEQLLQLDLSTSSRRVLSAQQTLVKQTAASAELDEVFSLLADGEDAAQTLAAWLTAHPEHPRQSEARHRLVAAYLDQTRRGSRPGVDSPLADSDRAAIELVAQILESIKPAAEKSKLILQVLTHLRDHYSSQGAYTASVDGYQAILAIPLPTQVRRQALDHYVDTQQGLVVSRLHGLATAGNLPAGPLPKDLSTLLETLATVNLDYPANPAWSKQAELGGQIAALGQHVDWPAKVTEIIAPEDWAVKIVVPVIVANHDPAATQAASQIFNGIVDRIGSLKQKPAHGLATRTSQRLLEVLPPDHPQWPAQVTRQLNLRLLDDAAQFAANIAAGRAHQNATLSDENESMLALASNLIARQPKSAPEVLNLLQPFFERRTKDGHDQAADKAYEVLEGSLPPAQLRLVQLAVAQMWVNQAIAQHNQLLETGFAPPQPLDEQMEKALVRCYELQADLEPGLPFVELVQQLRSKVIAHYRNLGYRQTAATAIAVKADRPVDWLDAKADFELASLAMSIALEELGKQTRQFQGRENVALTPAIQEAIAGLQQFVIDRPNDTRIRQAVEKIMAVGKTYEGYQKYDIASRIYRDLETFASQNEPLQYAKPNAATVAQTAAFAAAMATHTKATEAMQERLAEAPRTAPATELSEEFRAAIDGYQAILTKYPDCPLTSATIGMLMQIALQHAQAEDWDVASQVYAELAQQNLPLRRPERLDLAQALCEIGKVVPEHAQGVLAAITLWEPQSDASQDSISQIAMAPIPTGPGLDAELGGTGGVGGALLEQFRADRSAALGVNAPMAAGGAKDDPFGGDQPQAESTDELAAIADVDQARAQRETDLLAAVRRQQSAMATQIALLRDHEIQHVDRMGANQTPQQSVPVPILSDAEIARQQAVLEKAYAKLQAIRKTYSDTSAAQQARAQIMVIANHWRQLAQWERAAGVVKQYLQDNPTDFELPQLRHEIARDYLAWSAGAVKPDLPKQELLSEVNKRYTLAREELSGIIAAFPEHQALKHQAQWDIATSHLSQARVVATVSSTLARGQFVRAANELLATADLYHDHPKVGEIPQMLWSISSELTSRRFYDEAITVWNEMTLHYPGNPLAEQAALQIAQTYQNQLRLPLRAVESYLELNFSRGGNDVA